MDLLLIEMVSVLVMIGLFMVLVTPSLLSTLDRIQADSSVRKITSILASGPKSGDHHKNDFGVSRKPGSKSVLGDRRPKTEESSAVMELDRTIQFREFDDGEKSLRDGIFSVTFYPRGSTSGGTILLEPTDADAPSFLLTIDPVTGKPYVHHAS